MAIKRIEHVDLPYAGRRVVPNRAALAALYVRQGENLADISLRKGENTARLFERLGQLYTGYTEGVQQRKATESAMAIRAREREEDRVARETEKDADRRARIAERDADLARRTEERTADAAARTAEIEGARVEGTVNATTPGVVNPALYEQVKRLSPAMAARFQVQDGAPVLMRTPAQVRQAEVDKATAANTAADNARADRTLRVSEQNAATAERNSQAINVPNEIAAPLDPQSQDLMSQAGLSYNAFLALTGKMSALPRDRATRDRASREVADWARSKGMDVSTLASQYKAVNDTLETNIKRRNMVLSVQDELVGDVANLKTAAQRSGLTDARAANAAALWLRGQLNDPAAAEYAFALNALTNDLALYNAASTGRTADQSDINEAKQVVARGMAEGSLTGFETSLGRSVKNMGEVLERSVDRSRANVWQLFGVGDKYKPTVKQPVADDGAVNIDGFTVRVKPPGGG